MLRPRIIPILTLAEQRLVKTRKFKNPKYIGDPINAVRIFNEKEVDELIITDITAAKEKRSPNYNLIEQLASECFMPLTFGGGVRSLDQAKQIFKLGVEKISLNTALSANTNLISEISGEFGSQSVIASIDIKKNIFGSLYPFAHAKNKIIKTDYLELINHYVDAGVGEILLNSVDRDGMRCGPDLDLIKKVCQGVDVPVVALGGVSNLNDMYDMLKSGASAAAASSMFVFQGPHDGVLISYPNLDDN